MAFDYAPWSRACTVLYHIDSVTGICSVLLGRESVFLQDSIEERALMHPDDGVPFTKSSFSEYQNIRAENAHDATRILNLRAQALSIALMQPVKYDKPFYIKDKGVYRVHFRILGNNAGVMKGHIEKGETPIRAALRELYEEASVMAKYVYLRREYKDGYDYIYSARVNDDVRNIIENVIAKRNREAYGEMFDIQFIPLTIEAINNYSKRYNAISKKALQWVHKRYCGSPI